MEFVPETLLESVGKSVGHKYVGPVFSSSLKSRGRESRRLSTFRSLLLGTTEGHEECRLRSSSAEQAVPPLNVRNACCGGISHHLRTQRAEAGGRNGYETSLGYTGVSDQQRLKDPASIN